MAEPGKIIFVHGASSSGKSTIARGIQARIELPFWHISIDHLRDAGVLPTARFKSGEFDWKAARKPFFDGFHQSLAAYAGAGNNLVLEHILDTPGWLDELVALFSRFDVFFVGVHCPLPLLIEREQARGDRPIGSAEQDFRTIHAGKSYDFEVQTDADADENVARVIAAWNARTGESVFRRLAQGQRVVRG
ncbi:chloramphenicol phosphotransferase CPT family protein [Devosia beringensis]|uniref:chloramphenicol phosphotransferase CPT family protein n=1 Tax=Devosia beringensis TaxID=2657486 RepID=UPI00186BA75C|nr:AAA family ATPase [Devosia beringensis]